jgi:hypothetical protein
VYTSRKPNHELNTVSPSDSLDSFDEPFTASLSLIAEPWRRIYQTCKSSQGDGEIDFRERFWFAFVCLSARPALPWFTRVLLLVDTGRSKARKKKKGSSNASIDLAWFAKKEVENFTPACLPALRFA